MKNVTLINSCKQLVFTILAQSFVGLSAWATAIPVTNSSFESPAQTSGALTSGAEGDTVAVPGWTIGDGKSTAGVRNGGSPGYSTLDGSQVAYTDVTSARGSLATTQPVTSIVANTSYTVSVYVGNRSDGAASGGVYTVSLTDNGQVVNPVNLAGSTIAAGTFAQMTASYTPPATSVGHALGIKLSFLSTSGATAEGAFDLVQLNTSTGTNVAGTSFTFTLPSSYTTSAGVYTSAGKLVRTLWRKVFYTAGAHTQSWDGYDDNGSAVAAGNYTIKVLYHNVHYAWNGVIANTSSSFENDASRHGIYPIQGFAINGTNAYEARGYNESQSSMFRISTTAPQTLVASLRNGDNIFSCGWNYVACDGTKVYYACGATNQTNDPSGNVFPNQPGIVVAYNVSDNSNYAFSAGAPFHNCPDWMISYYTNYYWPNVVHVGTQPGVQGIAVQNSGNYLAVSVGADNKVYLLDKNTGAVSSSFTVTNPRALAFDPNGDLWVLTGTSAVRYTSLSTTPTAATTISGFSNPLAIAVHPTNADIVLIADGGIKQQVRGFTHLGAAASGWSSAFGTVGGNKLAGPAVTNTKFWFMGGNDLGGYNSLGEYTYLAIGADGSFWLGDDGNNRTLHFSSARAYIEQIAFLPDTLTCNVDANNSNRLFAGFLEYQVDYTKPLLPGDPYATGGNKSWKLVNNWGGNVDTVFSGFMNGPFSVATLSNGHTYGLIRQPYNATPIQVVELSSTGFRVTNDSTLSFGFNDHFELEADGSIRYAEMTGATVTWYTIPLTGFDASFNPQWGTPVVLATAPAGPTDPIPLGGSGDGYNRYPISSSNVLLSLNNSTTESGMHLGGVTPGTSNWLWEAAPSGALDFLGTYDLNAQYAGDVVVGSDRTVIYGYNGEFGPGTESNQFMHFFDDGLFIGEFGTFGAIENNSVGGAGNDFALQLVKVNGEKYLWHNDESGHGGLHRWQLVGENGIQEASGTGAMNTSIPITIPAASFPVNLAALPAAAKAALSWSPVTGASAYTVKYSTTRGGPYTTLSSTVATTTYSKTGLTNGTNYYFVVAATVGGVVSGNSNEVRVKPFDTTVTVQTAGYLYGGDVDSAVFPITTTNPAAGLPAFPSISDDILGFLWQYTAGSQGYALFNYTYNSSTGVYSDVINMVSPLTVVKSTGWGQGPYVSKQFSLNGVPEVPPNTFGGALGSTTGASIAINSPDANWHLLTVYCPTSFNGPNTYTLTLTAQGASTPTASFPVTNTIYDGWHQFLFKGNVTLTQTGTGNLKALFVDPVSVAITPVAPTGLTATAGSHQVSLAWPATGNATSYNIYRGTSAGGESTTAIATGVIFTNYVDTGLTTGTHYYYKIKAVNGVGTSPYSNEANATSL